MSEPIQDSDLDAYVDDQLDVARRIEVEAFLSVHPTSAAKVMADLRIKDELRLALALQPSRPKRETRHAARQLGQALVRRRMMGLMQRAAGIAIFVGAGWMAHAFIGPFGATAVVASVQPPSYVREAVKVHEAAARVEAGQTKIEGDFDPAGIRAATAIQLPSLPKGWRVIETQILPADHGPSVELAIEDRNGERLSLYAERPGNFTVQDVLEVHEDAARAAYWQIGEVGYALVAAPGNDDKLGETARRLARTLY